MVVREFAAGRKFVSIDGVVSMIHMAEMVPWGDAADALYTLLTAASDSPKAPRWLKDTGQPGVRLCSATPEEIEHELGGLIGEKNDAPPAHRPTVKFGFRADQITAFLESNGVRTRRRVVLSTQIVSFTDLSRGLANEFLVPLVEACDLVWKTVSGEDLPIYSIGRGLPEVLDDIPVWNCLADATLRIDEDAEAATTLASYGLAPDEIVRVRRAFLAAAGEQIDQPVEARPDSAEVNRLRARLAEARQQASIGAPGRDVELKGEPETGCTSNLRRVSVQVAQENAILAKLTELGFSPEALPPAPPGKSSQAKELVRKALTPTPMTPAVFNKAWQRLRSGGRTRDVTHPGPSDHRPNWSKVEGCAAQGR